MRAREMRAALLEREPIRALLAKLLGELQESDQLSAHQLFSSQKMLGVQLQHDQSSFPFEFEVESPPAPRERKRQTVPTPRLVNSSSIKPCGRRALST